MSKPYAGHPDPRKQGSLAAPAGAVPAAAPAWDPAQHTLSWSGRLVKHFRAEAPYQELILAAFDGAGWPACLPFAALAGAGLNGKDRLRDTIRNLNRSVRPYLRFRLEGSGTRVCCEIPAALPQRDPNGTLDRRAPQRHD